MMSYIYNAFKERILDETDLYLSSGNSVALIDGDFLDFHCSGSYVDNRISWEHGGVLSIPEESDMWKCQNCRKVYRIKDTLECKSCGSPVTEGSRFVLER